MEEILKAGTILYHGSKTGKFEINTDPHSNFLFFTKDIQMARDYSLLTFDKTFQEYYLTKGNNKKLKRIVFQVKLLKDLKFEVFDEDLTQHGRLNRTIQIEDSKKAGFDGIKMKELGFRNYKYINKNDIDDIQTTKNGNTYVKLKNEYTYKKYDEELNARPIICDGYSYYIFDLNNIRIIEDENLFESIIFSS